MFYVLGYVYIIFLNIWLNIFRIWYFLWNVRLGLIFLWVNVICLVKCLWEKGIEERRGVKIMKGNWKGN